MTADTILGYEEIVGLIPHRPPFLLIDQVDSIILNESARGIKNIAADDWFFDGHFPNNPVMPGVLIVEAMAQTSGVLMGFSDPEKIKGRYFYFTSIDKARFKAPVKPGDTLHLFVRKIAEKRLLFKMECEAQVAGKLVAFATVSAMVAE